MVCFPTTVAPILQNGFTPKFVDIDPLSLNLDLDQFEQAITDKTKAVIFAHVLGNPPDMDRVMKICKERDVLLLEDNCDALGSQWRGQPLGSFGIMSSCSFYPAHHITTGEGGMVSTDDEDLDKILRSLAWWGRDCYCVGAANLLLCGSCNKRFDRWLAPGYDGILDHKYTYEEVGYNLKPLDLQGAIGLVQLKKLPEIHEGRKRIYTNLLQVCSKYPHFVRTVTSLPEADVSWLGFPLTVVTDKFTREDLVGHLESCRIQTRNGSKTGMGFPLLENPLVADGCGVFIATGERTALGLSLGVQLGLALPRVDGESRRSEPPCGLRRSVLGRVLQDLRALRRRVDLGHSFAQGLGWTYRIGPRKTLVRCRDRCDLNLGRVTGNRFLACVESPTGDGTLRNPKLFGGRPNADLLHSLQNRRTLLRGVTALLCLVHDDHPFVKGATRKFR